jgi:hypothetical protein
MNDREAVAGDLEKTFPLQLAACLLCGAAGLYLYISDAGEIFKKRDPMLGAIITLVSGIGGWFLGELCEKMIEKVFSYRCYSFIKKESIPLNGYGELKDHYEDGESIPVSELYVG